MSARFLLRVKTDFSAAHSLRGYQGDCARIHGHNWNIEAEILTHKLNNIGIGIDFKDIKAGLKEILAPYDHQYINEIEPFDKINPTAENLSQYIFQKLKDMVNSEKDGIKLNSITIWETQRSSVRYEEVND